MSKQYVLLITNIIPPYRIPLFNYISNTDDFEFEVVALASNEKNRQWQINKQNINFNYDILSGIHFFSYSKDWGIHLNFGLLKKLFKYNPDVVITSGYDNLAYWQGFIYTKLFNKHYVLWNGSTLLSSNQNSGLIAKLKKTIIKNADRYVTYGTKAKEYLGLYGGNQEDIFTGLNTVDVNYYSNKVKKYRESEEFKLKRKKHPEVLLLFVGQLIERKGIRELLSAVKEIDSNDIGLMVVGDGRLKSEFENYCQKNNLDNVWFKGFVQKDEIHKYYALADCLVIPSKEEVWGLVVNEGLASGNFILASDQVGAVYDTLINDDLGLIFDINNIKKELISNINYCLENNYRINTNRNQRMEYAIENLNISKYGQAFKKAIKSIKVW